MTMTFALLLTMSAAAIQERAPLAVGEPVPSVRIATVTGETVDLNAWIGRKPVLIEFWATWCGACKGLLPQLEAVHRKFGDRVEFLIIAVDSGQTPDSVREYIEHHPLHGRVLWDTNGAAGQAFGPPGTGYVVLVDAKGRVAYTGAGPAQNLDAALARLVSSGHVPPP